jgi:hypothetical protein
MFFCCRGREVSARHTPIQPGEFVVTWSLHTSSGYLATSLAELLGQWSSFCNKANHVCKDYRAITSTEDRASERFEAADRRFVKIRTAYREHQQDPLTLTCTPLHGRAAEPLAD